MNEWINKLWHIHTMGYYLDIKINEVLIYATWMNLKNMLSERSQTQKVTYCMIPFISNIQNRQTHTNREHWCFTGAGWRRSDDLMGMRFPFGVMKMFWNEIEVMVAQYCEYTKCN